jgi:acetylornithine/succinyldiaminopimelate/putrescine aminotransferase
MGRVLAKGLGSGFPIGATLVSEKVASTIHPGMHASTFGGNPLACAAALATLHEMKRKNFFKKVFDAGNYFLEGLEKLKKKYSLIVQVRGSGLMVACELLQERGGEIVQAARKRGLLINALQNKILRFVPPLIVTKPQINEALRLLDASFQEVLQV